MCILSRTLWYNSSNIKPAKLFYRESCTPPILPGEKYYRTGLCHDYHATRSVISGRLRAGGYTYCPSAHAPSCQLIHNIYWLQLLGVPFMLGRFLSSMDLRLPTNKASMKTWFPVKIRVLSLISDSQRKLFDFSFTLLSIFPMEQASKESLLSSPPCKTSFHFSIPS